MKNKISQHPAIIHASDVSAICKPLRDLNITYFAHVNVTEDKQFSAIASNPEFVDHYLNKRYYNADIHMAGGPQIGEYVVWDAIGATGKTAQMNNEAMQFGVQHTFTIIDKNDRGLDCYHFSSDIMGQEINQVYVSNIDLLKLFIMHFKDKVRESKVLTSAYDMKFSIDNNADGFTVNQESNLAHHLRCRELFLNNIKINKHMIGSMKKPLSQREVEVLFWMHSGKTASEIAKLLGVADVTINKHIINIKDKTGCYSQFQLGEFFTRLCNDSEDIIQNIVSDKEK